MKLQKTTASYELADHERTVVLKKGLKVTY
jgi:hypothetical protein